MTFERKVVPLNELSDFGYGALYLTWLTRPALARKTWTTYEQLRREL